MDHVLPLPALIMLAVIGIAAVGFVAGAMVWLKRLRQHLAGAVGDALTRQIQHGQKVEEALLNLQKHQKQLETQVQTLAQAHARARADLNMLAQKMEQREVAGDASAHQSRILH